MGSLGSWLGGFFTYGFGQLIDSVEEIRKNHEAMQKRLESFENNLQRKEKVYKHPNTLPVEEEKKEYTEPLICADEMDGDESLPDTIVCPVCGKTKKLVMMYARIAEQSSRSGLKSTGSNNY